MSLREGRPEKASYIRCNGAVEEDMKLEDEGKHLESDEVILEIIVSINYWGKIRKLALIHHTYNVELSQSQHSILHTILPKWALQLYSDVDICERYLRRKID